MIIGGVSVEDYLDNRATCITRIGIYLSYLSVLFELMNNNHLTDHNTAFEQTICQLLNKLYGYQLKNRNDEEMNFPGIDLADAGRKLSVQVSSTAKSKKVRDTLDTFFEKNLDAEYDKLIFVFLSNSRPTVKDYSENIKRPFNFDPDEHIRNLTDLYGDICKLDDVNKIKEIAKFLVDECGKFPHEYEPRTTLEITELPSDFFIAGSRDDMIVDVERMMLAGEPVYLWGPGGIGKSQVARLAAWKFTRRYNLKKGPFSITYTPSPYEGEKAMIATILNAPIGGKSFIHPDPDTRKKEYDRRMEILETFFNEDSNRAVVILEDFQLPNLELEDLKGIKQDFPKIVSIIPHLLVTTRYSCGTKATTCVKALPQDQLVEQMLRHARRCDLETADPECVDSLYKLMELVDCSPIMAFWLAETMRKAVRLHPSDLLDALKTGDLDSIDWPNIRDGRSDIRGSLPDHIQRLYDINHLEPAARQVLAFASLIPETGLPGILFANALPRELCDTISNLVDNSWLRDSDGALSIYPVAGLACRGQLSLSYGYSDKIDESIRKQWDRGRIPNKQQVCFLAYLRTIAIYYERKDELLQLCDEIEKGGP